MDEIIIEPSKHGDGYDVYELGQYPKNSVNYGMTRKSFLGAYNTTEEAVTAHPSATVLDAITIVQTDPGPCPPSWFDPNAVDERWDDDY